MRVLLHNLGSSYSDECIHATMTFLTRSALHWRSYETFRTTSLMVEHDRHTSCTFVVHHPAPPPTPPAMHPSQIGLGKNKSATVFAKVPCI